MLRKWSALPANMQIPEVKPYYDALKKKQVSLVCKRIFDFILAFLLLLCSFFLLVFVLLYLSLGCLSSRLPCFCLFCVCLVDK